MQKIIGFVLTSIFCVACASEKHHNKYDSSFQEYKMSPLYLFQNTEEMENIVLKVDGKIPEWLQGEFVRNGPGIIQGKNGPVKSWFDGLAKLHGFSIKPGAVTYTCKFLQSEAYQKFQTTGDLGFSGFAQQSTVNSFSYYDFLFGIKNKEITNANVNVSKINNRLVALTEIPLPVEFDACLNTIGPFDYEDSLPKNFSFESAHILQDPNTKAMWNYLINIGLFGTAYQIYAIPPRSNERKLVASIPVSAISYMHSFSLAGRYAVLVDYPLRAKNPKDIGDGFIEAFSWFKNEPTIVYVADKESGKIWTFFTDSFFSYHHVNGFEKDGKVYVDLIAYPTADIIFRVNSYPFVKNPDNKLLRLEMDLSCNTIKVHQLSQEHFEFPRLNESLIGKEYQYFYAVHIRSQGNGIIKYNHGDSKNIYWFQEGSYANEPVFVPHPRPQSEDDGVILSVINDLKHKKSFLLILNAKDLKELGRVHVPLFIPFGFHGQFFEAIKR
jgi:carotenoid cleavage dioxygenase-like enzyme